MSSKAFFLDRDGVINVDHGYVSTPESFEFIPGVFEACQVINEHDYKIVIVTNQSGIGRGYYSEKTFLRLTDWMLAQFTLAGVAIAQVKYCPHHATQGIGQYLLDCDCRKPNPGMIKQAVNQHNIDVGLSVMVGDKMSDVQAGIRSDIATNYLIGASDDSANSSGYLRCANLADAVNHYFGE